MIKTVCKLKDYSSIESTSDVSMESDNGRRVLLVTDNDYLELDVAELIEAIENCTGIRLNPTIVRWGMEAEE